MFDLIYGTKQLTKHKAIEGQIYVDLLHWGIGFTISRNSKEYSHWGWEIELQLLPIVFRTQYYDGRHPEDLQVLHYPGHRHKDGTICYESGCPEQNPK